MNYKQLSENISAWLQDYLVSNKLDCFVIGVSGGIDSAVVSTLCALTKLPVYAYGLPCNSHKENNKNSELQLNWLKKNFPNVKTDVRDLSDTFITFKDGLKLTDLSKANTKSRLRMVFLYAMASNYNGLVVGTGNLIEDGGIGFFTKYGDGGVDISPIGELTKTQVWNLGRYLEVPQEIIDAKPTDGLHEENHADEVHIGASYEELEKVMSYFSNPVEYSTLSGREIEVLDIYLKFHRKNAHKMQMPPIFKVDKSKY